MPYPDSQTTLNFDQNSAGLDPVHITRCAQLQKKMSPKNGVRKIGLCVPHGVEKIT